ncbi:D-2-hydroxyacid dehydrogenase family protein [Parapusillimonas granuli]|uniref:D-2-hydroxyacid dehydrogenase family protein n=1 Tax=Parapusillimonas granuli TaxID=380911 RepID=A0A853FZ90_9BURK|nr:D-2-hydroxyacid dehydrogenase family protein [Parapusillimonas granuli]MBB5216254.1 phosphoglycerate dehydrogenase-like enzyme [Parapusillimonas granuli]MEB2400528.1 D-2-hydroxyacid dehydrogenase family protein [Alcaligenaceae bacterium]NYT47931.1 D-2-hydroxyacid dehydrogenase family protein [Parapusillimonas granuli]
MKIAVLDDYQAVARQCGDWAALGPDASVDFITRPIPADELPLRLKPYDVIVAMRERTPFPGALLRQLPNLRLLVTTGSRNRAIDVPACRELGIPVCGTRSDPLLAAELAWALVMALYKRVAGNDADVRAGRWQPVIGQSLKGTTLGLLGLGKLGQRMAQFGKLFGMEVIAWSPNLTPERCEPFDVECVGKRQLFERADVVSIHMVLSAGTRHLVGRDELGWMKKTAYLVNTSRGPLVDEQALCEALHDGRIAGAALDVFDQEPLPADAEILKAPNVLLSPHVGYVSWQNYQTYYGDAIEDIRQWLAGEPLRVLEA